MNTNSIKENLRSFYNREAQLRDASEKKEWKLKVREDFLNLALSENKTTLLEIGAGTGQDSRFFMDSGLTVTATDLSAEMINKCREKSINAHELDYYNLSSLNQKYDCIWAMNTLLHTPKADLSAVLNEIDSVLNEDGLFYIGIYGSGEDSEHDYFTDGFSDTPRFYSFYSNNSLKAVLENHFQIVSFEQFEVDNKSNNFGILIFQSIVMRKRM